MNPVERYLRGLGSPVCTIACCGPALEISYATILQRLKNNPDLTRPDTFLAGGKQMMMVDDAIAWCEQHQIEWAALQAAKGRG